MKNRKVIKLAEQDKNNLMEMARRILEAKIGKGMKQIEIAAQCGLSPSYIKRFLDEERGRENPDLVTLLKLKHGLEIDGLDLCSVIEPDKVAPIQKLSSIMQDELNKLAELSPKDLEKVRNILRAFLSI